MFEKITHPRKSQVDFDLIIRDTFLLRVFLQLGDILKQCRHFACNILVEKSNVLIGSNQILMCTFYDMSQRGIKRKQKLRLIAKYTISFVCNFSF